MTFFLLTATTHRQCGHLILDRSLVVEGLELGKITELLEKAGHRQESLSVLTV